MDWFRRGEFQRHWTRNFLFFFLPGFVVFAIGILANSERIALAGWVLSLVSVGRGARVVWKYKRCPSCGHLNVGKRRGYDGMCWKCGAGLPGDPDATVF